MYIYYIYNVYIGEGFEVYLPVVIAPVLIGANQEIKFSMEDAIDDDVDGDVIYT
jgi:hypothetical protein